jgi:hypothetical protein
MNEDQAPEDSPLRFAIKSMGQDINPTESNKEMGIIARVDPEINSTLLHHIDHGKINPIIVVGLGSHAPELNHKTLIKHVKDKDKKVFGIIGGPINNNFAQGGISIIDDSFNKKLNNDLKKEINVLNYMIPFPQEGTNRAARRKKNKKK